MLCSLNQKFVDQADGKADIVQVDFKDSEATGRKFKKWVDQKTKGGLKINDISFDQSTKMALTSALYFKSTWIYKFQPAKKGIFKGPKGDVEVEMMQMKQQFRWGKIDDYAEWVAIPYESEDSLVIILPNKNKTLDDVMTTFNERALTEIMYDFDRDSADVSSQFVLTNN